MVIGVDVQSTAQGRGESAVATSARGCAAKQQVGEWRHSLHSSREGGTTHKGVQVSAVLVRSTEIASDPQPAGKVSVDGRVPAIGVQRWIKVGELISRE